MQAIGADGEGESRVGGDKQGNAPGTAQGQQGAGQAGPVRGVVMAQDDGASRGQGGDGGARVGQTCVVGQ